MHALLALTMLMPIIASKPSTDNWQPFTSLASRIRFEVPTEPVEHQFSNVAGSDVRSFVCKSGEIVFEAVAMEMELGLKLALQEAVSDAEVSVSRQLIDGLLEDSLQGLGAIRSETEYTRLQKFPCRTTIAKVDSGRDVKLLTVISKSHMYLFIVSYPNQPDPKRSVDRFFNSIRFEK